MSGPTPLDKTAKFLRQHRLSEYGPFQYRCTCGFTYRHYRTLKEVRGWQSFHTARALLESEFFNELAAHLGAPRD